MTSHAQLAHIWAQQEKSEGQASRMFFEGATIYSYGRHYKLAHFVKDKHGHPAVLINNQGYSVSTARHTSYVRSAVAHLPTYEVPRVVATCAEDHKYNLAALDFELACDLKAAMRARKHKAWKIERLESAWANRNRYGNAFITRFKPKPFPADVDAAGKAAVDAEIKASAKDKARIAKQAKLKLLNEIAAVRQAEKTHGPYTGWVARWRQGKALPEFMSGYDIAQRFEALDYVMSQAEKRKAHGPYGELLRPESADSITTSKNASFPASHAKKAYKLWARLQGKVPPEGWQRQADSTEGRVGNFKIDSIEANGTINAGCHTIYAEEVKAFASFMGWSK